MARKNKNAVKVKTRRISTPFYTQYCLYSTQEFGNPELVRVVSMAGDYLTIEHDDGSPSIVHLSTINFTKRR
jgi:hypothetical protein